MSTATRLTKLAEGLDSNGVLSAAKGGTGNTTGGGTTSPTISQIAYLGNDTATDPAGGGLITLTGTNFASGAKVLINTTQVSVVTVVSTTQITFTAPQLAVGSYILYVVNLDGSTAIAVPGIQYSGVPAWTTAADTLGTTYETAAISTTVAATSNSAVTYSVFSGTLPTGATLASNGTISGTSPVTSSSTTYTFTIRATDAENQDTDRSFSLTINPDVVSWSSPANAAALTGAPGVAYSSALSATSAAGQTVSYSANALPTGLAISGSTITGTPTTAGSSSTTLTATAAVTNRSAQVTISWTIVVTGDAYFPYTTLLLNSETTATPFTADASTNNFAVTINGDTKPSNFNPYTPGYYSNYFDGTGDSLTIASNAAFAYGTDAFTVEFWVYSIGTAAAQVWVINSGLTLNIQRSGSGFYNVYDGTDRVSTTSVVSNVWNHVAVVRTGTGTNQTNLYVNGVSVLNWTNAVNYGADNFALSGSATYPCTCYISNLRVVKGTAVYTANFTPPTTPLTAIANTSLLTCQSNRLIDTSTNSFTITKNGDTTVSGFVPFVPNTSYSTYGSGYFDGTGDYLSVPSNAALNFGTGDFTIEFWVYSLDVSSSTQKGLFQTSDTAGGLKTSYTSGIMLIQGVNGVSNASGALTLNICGTNFGSGASPVITTSTWYHIAITRQSGTASVFLNGSSIISGSAAASIPGTYLAIGGYYDTTYSMSGYLSNVRVVKGTALYTANFVPPQAPLTAVTNTSLLTLQTNQPLNNSVFLDNSTNNFLVTRNGNTTQGTFSPYGSNWSNYFDGTGDYLNVGSVGYANLDITSGDFTVECWVYNSGAGAERYLFSQRSTGNGWEFRINATNLFQFFFTGGSSITSTAVVPGNQWVHLAATRSGNTVRLFINGALDSSTTFANGTSNSSWGVRLGYSTTDSGYLLGYLSNARLVKGTAIYTATFTPSTIPLTAVSGTSFLTCQSPQLIDNSANNFTITKVGDVSVQRFSPFSTVTQTPQTYSGYFDGTGDYLQIAHNTALDFDTGDFSVEAWVYPTGDVAYSAVITKDAGSGAGWFMEYSATRGLFVAWASTTMSSAAAYVKNSWSHLVFCRSGTTVSIYRNGTRLATATSSASISSANNIRIGALNYTTLYEFPGYISNARVVKGSSPYDATQTTCTVPTTPLTAITNTKLLTCQDATFKDNSTNAFAITAVGNTTPRAFNPFGYTNTTGQAYTPALYGGSAYFDGTGDKLSLAANASLALGTGDFTIEMWVYNQSTTNRLISYATTTSPIIYFNASNFLLYENYGVGTVLTSSIAVPLNTWAHIAVSRATAVTKIFINGVQGASGADTNNWGQNGIHIGVDVSTTYMTGYLSNVRVVKGTAVYTSNFVPPSAPLTAVQNTSLLTNMTSAGIYDNAMMNNLETVGNTQISTSVKKYGTGSIAFDGTGDYLSIPSSPNFDFGSGDFTIEFWLYLNATTGQNIIAKWWTGGQQWVIQFRAGGQDSISNQHWRFYANNGSTAATDFTEASTTSVAISTWYHIVLSRNGSSYKFFRNGTQVGSTYTNAAAITTTTDPLTIGQFANSTTDYLNGYIDDLRFTKGFARYTANFTPPTATLITK